MKIESLKDKTVYISPHSPISLAFERYLRSNAIATKGFLDRSKSGKSITKIELIKPDQVDYIAIISPNHFDAIADEYLQYIDQKRLIKVELKDNEYRLDSDFEISKKAFAYNSLDIEIDRTKIVFISKGFISSNNKALYLHCIKNNIETVMLTDNSSQLDELKKHALPCEILDTKEADYEIAIAKYIIFDQGNYTYLPPLAPDQKTVQLWHGVGLKKMNRLENITYDFFISTSKWTNRTNFEQIFSAEEFLNLGYPRNDIFFRDEDNLDLLFTDQKIYEIVKNSQKRVILYMPTHRENRLGVELDFEKLNQKLQQLDAFFILKLHPFVLEYYKDSKDLSYSHILFHNASGDIYPILKYVDTLISDYSSVVYDFLLLDREVIFYCYDKKEYTKSVSLLFDYDEFSPGIKAKNQDELFSALFADDNFAQKRAEIKELFFDKIAQNISSKNILKKLLEEQF